MDTPCAKWTWRSAAAVQMALAAAGLMALAFAPPAHGRTLLVPISGGQIAPKMLDRLMLTPIARGPVSGSLVVEGIGRAHAGILLDNGIIMLAAPAALCSPPADSGGKA